MDSLLVADALVGVMMVNSRATVRPLHEDSNKSAGRSRLPGKRCSGATVSPALINSSAVVSRSTVCPREMAQDLWHVTA